MVDIIIQMHACVHGAPYEVAALTVMYTSLNSPSQLTGWRSSGGDPCGESWKGIECSGSSVTEIRLSGLGLTGTMGYQLSSLTSVTYFDLSKNKLSGDIPYQLPPNVLHINLASNSFTGGIPYSISQMTDLKYLNLGHNRLSGQLSDMFGKLPKLSLLDLSFNSLSGNLPPSFASLKSLSTLYLHNNQFTGPIDALARLPLDDLNVENNRFTGWIPKKLKDIDAIQTQGNKWSDPQANEISHSFNNNGNTKFLLKVGAIAVSVVILLILAVFLLVIVARKSSSSPPSHFLDDEKFNQKRSFSPLVSREFKELQTMEATSFTVDTLDKFASMGVKPPPNWQKSSSNNEVMSRFSSRKSTDLITATAYSLEDLQGATGSFGLVHDIGQGSIGHVYKAKYEDGKVLAVKKIDSAILENGGSEEFMNVVSRILQLRHPNITELVGHCAENGYYLLVYQFLKNGSLHDFLHLSDEYSKPLTWNTRIRIALGTARAVEYLHEICSPSTMHKNIKSSNILLDTELNPHLSECGLATFYQHTSWSSEDGYNAPECIKPSAYTLKSDVYSFGVVMLELLTGRKPFDSSKPIEEQSLVGWAAPHLHNINALEDMVDPALRGLYPPKSLSRFADVIALCVQTEPEFRPLMSEVVQSLGRCA
ncbi:protein STRUBBELIG-RECEPTOR FAMILY 5-like isoform X2 [Magnolia sinica]|uniref:protein STRUBBELIG-RECEPTOR FAMILY 5-like isoform X2 n=1 Tax=Magnolia sinica TaxID=86752 RepID=UPI0026587775|nr:protein STRUBBELIG-RECEPTOR FAMILY 5-like isoform X2 [Magnolia sinica]